MTSVAFYYKEFEITAAGMEHGVRVYVNINRNDLSAERTVSITGISKMI